MSPFQCAPVYGYAFNSTEPFTAPFHAQPVGKGNWGIGHTTNGRVGGHDRIPFQRSLGVNMELFHWQPKRKVDYATTTHWYAFDDQTDNGQTAPERVRESVAQVWADPDDFPEGSIGSLVRRTVAENRAGRFIEGKFAGKQGGTLPFQIFIPTNPTGNTRLPLLLFLHGAGDLGEDNHQQLSAFPRAWVALENQAKHPCFVVAPQCPKSDAWSSFPEYPTNARAAASPTAATLLAIELVEALIAECSVDPSRIYVTGLSLGGEGTFDIVSRRPDLFAAAVPICGIADVERAAAMASVPFWVFHGERDDINPVTHSRDIVQALKSKGATPIYTEYPGAGHDIWSRAYGEPGLIPWLFKQHK